MSFTKDGIDIVVEFLGNACNRAAPLTANLFQPLDQHACISRIGDSILQLPAPPPSTLRTSRGVCFTDAGWPEKDDILATLKEAEGVQVFELLAFHGQPRQDISA